MSKPPLTRGISCAAVVSLFAIVCAGFAQTQIQSLNVNDSDRYAASQAQDEHIHVLPVATPGGRAAAAAFNASQNTNAAHEAHEGDHSRVLYPADLQYLGGTGVPGVTDGMLHSTVHHAVFVNTTPACPPNSCWGDPAGFMKALFRSEYIHITDEYTGTSPDHTVGDSFTVNYPLAPGVALQGADRRAIVLAVAAATGAGPGQMLEIFLPPGQDDCLHPGICFSPDNPSTFAYCAYHNSFILNGQIYIYSVLPYMAVPGCEMNPATLTPNGQVADTMDYGISHEIIETITDVRGTGWWNSLSYSLYGAETADECFLYAAGQTGNPFYFYTQPSIVRWHGKQYAVAPQYSNGAHGCVTSPADTDDD